MSRPYCSSFFRISISGWRGSAIGAAAVLVVVLGLIAQLAFGAWWIDAVTSLAIVWFLVKEGREAWQIEEHDHNIDETA